MLERGECTRILISLQVEHSFSNSQVRKLFILIKVEDSVSTYLYSVYDNYSLHVTLASLILLLTLTVVTSTGLHKFRLLKPMRRQFISLNQSTPKQLKRQNTVSSHSALLATSERVSSLFTVICNYLLYLYP